MSKYFLNKEDFEAVMKRPQVVDDQIADILNSVSLDKQSNGKSEFREAIDRVRNELFRAARDNGGLELKQVFAFRRYYLQRELSFALNAGSTDAPTYILIQCSRVFDAALSRALQYKAGRLTKSKAADWDEVLIMLNSEHNTAIFPQRREGSEYMPCRMEDIAVLEDSFASSNGAWSWAPQKDGSPSNSMAEPYANPLDMSAEYH